MKAARIHDYGAAPVLDDVPPPSVGLDEVLIRVEAASLNPLDLLLRGGQRRDVFPLAFPYPLGTDVAGTVERTGALVAGVQPGARVVARLDPVRGGGLSEYAVLPATQVAPAPSRISLAEAAGVPTAAGTAWQALFETARVNAGHTVLVHAGAGGVGSFAIQLAKLAGARVIATASGTGCALAQQLGADQVIDYRTERFADQLSNVDVVIDTVGGEPQARSFGVMRPGGHLVATAAPPDPALASTHRVTATRISHRSDGSRLRAILALIEAGRLRVLVDRIVPLHELTSALEHQASGHARGKIIVTLA